MLSFKKSLEKSSKTAVEAINNIRTVAGLRCEERVIREYERALQEPISNSTWSIQVRGFVLGFSNSNFLFAYGVCYFYGAGMLFTIFVKVLLLVCLDQGHHLVKTSHSDRIWPST